MSKGTYQIEYDNTKIKADQIMSALNEIAKQIDAPKKSHLSQLNWLPKVDIEPTRRPRFDVDKPVFEAPVPPEFTKDVHVFNEVLRVVPINDKTIHVVVTDASIPPSKCEEIAIDFARRLYEKATGVKITKEQILVNNVAGLPANICEHCLQSIEGLPNACKVCGRTFCYDHRRPETHGCQLKIALGQPQLSTVKQQHESQIKTTQPRVIIRRIHCG